MRRVTLHGRKHLRVQLQRYRGLQQPASSDRTRDENERIKRRRRRRLDREPGRRCGHGERLAARRRRRRRRRDEAQKCRRRQQLARRRRFRVVQLGVHIRRPGVAVRVSRVLRLRVAADTAVPERAPGVQHLPPEAQLLSDMSRPAGQHSEPGHGKGGFDRHVSVQVLVLRLPRVPVALREGRARRAVRVPPVHLSVSGRLVQVARRPGTSHGTPDGRAQVDHHTARRRHSVLGHGHKSSWCRGLGDDAVVFRTSFHARVGKARKVRRPSTVFRHRAVDRQSETVRKLRVQAGAQRTP